MKQSDLYCRGLFATSGLPQFIESLGGNPRKLFQEAGVDQIALTDRYHVSSCASVCRLYELAAESLGEPYFGLKWALNMPKDYRASGATLFQLFVAPDLREFIDMATKYQMLNNNGISYRVFENMDTGEISTFLTPHPLAPSCRQLCEAKMAAIAVMGFRYVEGLKFTRITLQYRKPADVSLYEDIFKCPVEFDAERNSIVVDRTYLEVKKTRLTTRFLAPFLKSYLNHQVKKHPQNHRTMTLMTYDMIPSILGLGTSSLPHVARALEMHPKKMQRLLQDEDSSYSNILDDVRKNMAEHFLRDSDITVQRLAKMLDYASDTSFARASVRWFGMSPSQYRQHIRDA